MKSALAYILIAGSLVGCLHGKAAVTEPPAEALPGMASITTTTRPAESAPADSASAMVDDNDADDDVVVPFKSTSPAPLPMGPPPEAAAVVPTTLATPSSTATTASIENMSTCIRCICLSLSQCDASVCDPQTELCDLWHITYMVWRASGSPMIPGVEYPNPISAFENCRSNDTCAARSITQYFELNKADCNSDGVIDCLDVTIIHTAGPHVCRDSTVNLTTIGISECMAGTPIAPTMLHNSDEEEAAVANSAETSDVAVPDADAGNAASDR